MVQKQPQQKHHTKNHIKDIAPIWRPEHLQKNAKQKTAPNNFDWRKELVLRCRHAHMHGRKHACVHARAYACTHACTHTCVHSYMLKCVSRHHCICRFRTLLLWQFILCCGVCLDRYPHRGVVWVWRLRPMRRFTKPFRQKRFFGAFGPPFSLGRLKKSWRKATRQSTSAARWTCSTARSSGGYPRTSESASGARSNCTGQFPSPGNILKLGRRSVLKRYKRFSCV